MLRPMKVTFESMKIALAHSFEMYASSKWTKKNFELYLSRNCFSGELISAVCCNAGRKRYMTRMMGRTNAGNQSELNKLLKLKLVSKHCIRFHECNTLRQMTINAMFIC